MKPYSLKLLGHHKNKALVKNTITSGRSPHAWLLTGPKGVGKACFAEQIIRDLLHHEENRDLSLHTHYHALQSDGAPINIEHVRALIDFLNLTASDDLYRFCIIDSIDALHMNASNALLKILEEPPPRTIFFLIAHNPYHILKTIRSRCVALRFQNLSYEETLDIVTSLAPSVMPFFDDLFPLLKGTPGQYVTLATHNGLDLFRDLKNIFEQDTINSIQAGLLIQKIIENQFLYDVFKTILWTSCVQKMHESVANLPNISRKQSETAHFLTMLPKKFYKAETLHLDKNIPFLEIFQFFNKI
jgi:DNA polymerase III delta prime subunit